MPRVFAVGDPIIDENVVVKATHIAPDAPIQVCVKDRVSVAPGGLWNAAGNLKAAGADTYVFGVIGNDLDSFTIENFTFTGRACSLVDPMRHTQRKTRFLGQNLQQLLRVDIPKDGPITDGYADTLAAKMRGLPFPDAILVSDYGCGVVTKRLMEQLRTSFPHVTIVVDPYPTTHPSVYRGADYLKLNRYEFDVLSGKLLADERLIDIVNQGVIITSGPDLCETKTKQGSTFLVSVPHRDMVDPCGAGDAFSGYLTWAFACGADALEAVTTGVHAGACAVTRKGVYIVTPQEVYESIEASGDEMPACLSETVRVLK